MWTRTVWSCPWLWRLMRRQGRDRCEESQSIPSLLGRASDAVAYSNLLYMAYAGGVAERDYIEITEMLSGMVFRFYTDRAQPHRLHIKARWGVEPETAIRAFFDDHAQMVWLPQKACFETRTSSYVLAWLRMGPRQILVITCVPRELAKSVLSEAEEDSA
jgi:hypothetical protein